MTETRCVACIADIAVLRNAHRRNVNREARNLPPVFDEIERTKAHMAECSRAGHHDATAGPAASRRSRAVATNP